MNYLHLSMSLIKRHIEASDEEVYSELYIDSDYEYQQWMSVKTIDLDLNQSLNSSQHPLEVADHKF